jgi:predicted peptidase
MILLWGGASAMQTSYAADVGESFAARSFTDSTGTRLLYRQLQPKDYDAKQRYPLVIFLHGAGERGDDNRIQLKHGMANYAADDLREKFPAFVIAPQCPANQKWVDVDWSGEKHTQPPKASPSMHATRELIDALQKEYSIDADRIYITGLSMGGYGTWDALQRFPELFAAGAPICGGGDPSLAERIKHIPIWVFHGEQDTVVKPIRSRSMVEALEAAGAKPKYTEYPKVGHDSWTATYANPEFHAWLFSQKRSQK